MEEVGFGGPFLVGARVHAGRVHQPAVVCSWYLSCLPLLIQVKVSFLRCLVTETRHMDDERTRNT